MFLLLPLKIRLSLLLADLTVSDCGLFLLQAYVSALLGDQLSQGGIWDEELWYRGQLWGTDRNWKDPVPGCSLVPVSWGFRAGHSEQKCWSYLCLQACLHSREISSLPEVFGYWVLWHSISSGHCGTESSFGADRNQHGIFYPPPFSCSPFHILPLLSCKSII